MEHLSQEKLKEMMLLSYKKIEENKEQINKINVFPVPDQDTGSNLAHTLSGIKEAFDSKQPKDLKEISEVALDGALTKAQGNAGVIYTGFLAGFFPELVEPIDVKKLALAFEKGAARARQSIQNPKQGTILDVIDAASEVFNRMAKEEKDIVVVFKKATEEAKEALLATREKMAIFIKANVVDAGGMGFLLILESYLEALEGEKAVKKEAIKEKPSEKIKRFIQTLAYRYEIIALIKDPKIDEATVKERLRKLGNSLDIIHVQDRMKIHIHTDNVDEVKNVIRNIGLIENLRVEDMAREVTGEESVRKVSIGIVTEDIVDLPSKVLERYQIETVSLIVDLSDVRDLPGENIYQKMISADKKGMKIFLKTSQATPRSYFDAYKKQLEKFDKVLCLTVSSKVSGCYNSAKQAEEMINDPGKIFVLDTEQAAAGHALLVLKAVELIQEQREILEVIDEVKKLIPKTYFSAAIEDPKWIEAGGRITRAQANWIRRIKKMNLHPFITLKNGAVVKDGIIWAPDTTEAIFKKIAKDSKKFRKKGQKIRIIINHADNPEAAEQLRKKLKQIKTEIPFITLASPVIGAHIGPGSLIVGWQPIDVK